MSKQINIFITVTLAEQADPGTVAESVFDFLASDPDDLFPAIETVEDFDYVEVETDG
jgi:hypothetical protein